MPAFLYKPCTMHTGAPCQPSREYRNPKGLQHLLAPHLVRRLTFHKQHRQHQSHSRYGYQIELTVLNIIVVTAIAIIDFRGIPQISQRQVALDLPNPVISPFQRSPSSLQFATNLYFHSITEYNFCQ